MCRFLNKGRRGFFECSLWPRESLSPTLHASSCPKYFFLLVICLDWDQGLVHKSVYILVQWQYMVQVLHHILYSCFNISKFFSKIRHFIFNCKEGVENLLALPARSIPTEWIWEMEHWMCWAHIQELSQLLSWWKAISCY